MYFRINFKTITTPTSIDVQTDTREEAIFHALDILAIYFKAQDVPSRLAKHFIARIDNLSEEEIDALCPPINSVPS
jgi:hypothetical protein